MKRLGAILAACVALAAAPASGDVLHGGGPFVTNTGHVLSCPFAHNATCETRTLTTTRASSVPCLQSDGTWGTVPADTACIAPGGVAGVESYGSVLNYVTDSTDLSGWTVQNAATRTLMSDATGSFWRICDEDTTDFAGFYKVTGLVSGDVGTSTLEIRANSAATVRILVDGNSWCDVSPTPVWSRLSCTKTLTGGGLPGVYPTPNPGSATGCVDVRQAQQEKSPTPGRRCDSGASPTTCAADVHTVPADGFPVASGRVRLRFTPGATLSGAVRSLVIADDGSDGWWLYVRNTDALTLRILKAGVASINTGSALTWTAAHPYEILAVWGGGAVRIYRDGVLVTSATGVTMPASIPSTAKIGADVVGASNASGTVSLVEVSR